MKFRPNNKQNFKTTPFIMALVLAFAACGAASFIHTQKASASAFTQAYVRLDNLTATTPTGGRVCIKPANAVASGGFVVVNFPTTAATDYVVNSTAANWTTNTTFESGFGGTALPISGNVASSVTGKAVKFTTSGALAVGTLYCFNFSGTNTLTTSSAGAAVNTFAYVQTQTSGSVQIDQTYWGATIITGQTVTVNAVVAPFFTMALSATTDTFASNLSSSSVNKSNGNNTIQVDTNALNGYILWVKDSNFKTVSDTGSSNKHGALTSVSAGGYAISNNTVNYLATPNLSSTHTFASGAEDYGLGVTLNTNGTGAGTTTINGVYDGSTVNQGGVLDPTQYRPIASSAGTAVAAKVNIFMLTTISNSTPPGNDYTDTLTYVGAGQF